MQQRVTHVLFVVIEKPDLHKYLLDAVEMRITSNGRVYHISSSYNDEKTCQIITQLIDKFRKEHGTLIAAFLETQHIKELWTV